MNIMLQKHAHTKEPNCSLFVSLHPDVIGQKAALLHLAKCLFDNGCVKSSYLQAVVEREKEYPTGLKINGRFNIALAHAGPDHVNQNAIVVGILDETIDFHLMGEPDNTIPVQIIFMFAATDFNSISGIVNKLVDGILIKPEIIDQIIKMNSQEQILSLLSQIILEND